MDDKQQTPVEVVTRRAALIYELAIRLRPACADWPEELFSSMVENLADITLKYEGRTSVSGYDRRSTERLIEDLRAAVARNRASLNGKPTSDDAAS